jgi:hypothetical protein
MRSTCQPCALDGFDECQLVQQGPEGSADLDTTSASRRNELTARPAR